MNILEQFHRDPQRVLDRLVDDELTADERRALLVGIDDHPAAWRRCALAFLENQAWRRSLGCPPNSSTKCDGESDVALYAVARRAPSRRWLASLGVAASVLAAFGLGARFSAEPPTAGRTVAADHDLPGSQGPNKALPASVRPASAGPAVQNAANVPQPFETLLLVPAGDDDSANQFRVRIANAAATGASAGEESALPDELLQQLEEAGLNVSREQRWVRLELSDGRRVAVPIEEVNIAYPEVARN